MARPFTLAHLTDVHLPPLPPFWPRHWNVKRALGFINWQRKRRHIHLRTIVDRLVADLHAQNVDHILVSGDLVNIGLPEEYERALDWLKTLGTPHDVTVIPGNHDIYCPLWTDIGVERWRPYMTNSTSDGAQSATPHGFPFVRRFGDVAIIGINSAVPTPPGVASGEAGAEQLDRLAQVLEQLWSQMVHRVVMIHHPPLPGQAQPMRALRDAQRLADILRDHGAELVVHGHNHRNMLSYHHANTGNFPVVGAPSFSAGRSYRDEPLGAYNLYHLQCDRGSSNLIIDMVQRGFKENDDLVCEIQNRRLLPKPPMQSEHTRDS